MPSIIINEQPIRTKHIGWFTGGNITHISLFELVERTYLYAENHLAHKQLEKEFKGTLSRNDKKASSWILLEAVQNTISQIRENL